jgi:hypothetical protein
MTIVLTYTTEDGTQNQAEFRDDVARIDLSKREICSIDLTPLKSHEFIEINLSYNNLKSINISPLSSCKALEDLLLGYNQLQSIDLTPLAFINLRALAIYENQLQSIDLTPLSTHTDLRQISLSHNQLQAIDLAPLSSCTKLQSLILSRNQLKSIDLSPLSSHTSMTSLLLSENQFQAIDLTPLAFYTSLRELDLSRNQLKSIDLSPLSSYTSMTSLDLSRNQFDSNDATYLFKGPRLNSEATYGGLYSWLNIWNLSYKRPASTYSWSFLHHIAQQHGKDRRVQQDLLFALSLGDYGFLDHDLSDIFLSFPPETSILEVRETITKHLVEAIVASVERGGTTTGLDLETMIASHGEIAVRAQRIIELRSLEMQKVGVSVRGTNVDLRELWLTAYGYEVLTALIKQHGFRFFRRGTFYLDEPERLGFKLSSDLEVFDLIKNALDDLGFKLKIGETSVSGVKMSEYLKQTIWWIVEYQGRPWREIKELKD